MEHLLEISNITKSFGGVSQSSRERLPLLKGIDLQVEKQQLTALIGGNGAGKTTLLNIINGFMRADSGHISYRPSGNQILLDKLPPHEIARMGIGRLFQGTKLFGNLSIRENLLIACNEFGIEKPFYNLYASNIYKKTFKQMNGRVDDLFLRLGSHELKRMLDNKAKSISYGQQRIINLMGLLLGNYKLVLLDEPTSGIPGDDWETIEAIINVMKLSGTTIFLIEHNMEFIRKYVNSCYYMSSGRILVSGKTMDVLNHKIVQSEYLALC